MIMWGYLWRLTMNTVARLLIRTSDQGTSTDFFQQHHWLQAVSQHSTIQNLWIGANLAWTWVSKRTCLSMMVTFKGSSPGDSGGDATETQRRGLLSGNIPIAEYPLQKEVLHTRVTIFWAPGKKLFYLQRPVNSFSPLFLERGLWCASASVLNKCIAFHSSLVFFTRIASHCKSFKWDWRVEH